MSLPAYRSDYTRRRCSSRVVVVVAALALAVPSPASAHGLTGRADLPIPIWLFSWGAAVVMVLSFAALGTLWSKPRLEDDRFRPLPDALGRVLTSRGDGDPVRPGGRAVARRGHRRAASRAPRSLPQNLTPTFVYVVFWLGVRPGQRRVRRRVPRVQPVARGRAGRRRGVRGARAGAARRTPSGSGYWPAAAGLLAFAWLELVSPYGDRPSTIAWAIVVYSVADVVRDGALRRRGLDAPRRGVLGLLRAVLAALAVRAARPRARAAPVPERARARRGARRDGRGRDGDDRHGHVRRHQRRADLARADDADDELGRRPRLRAALRRRDRLRRPGCSAVIAICSPPCTGWRRAPTRAVTRCRWCRSRSPTAPRTTSRCCSSRARTRSSSPPTRSGAGWDLFGTADGRMSFFISAEVFWYLQLFFVIGGHVAAIVLAHDRALVMKAGRRSQQAMLAVMVGFTVLALWLLSEASKGYEASDGRSGCVRWSMPVLRSASERANSTVRECSRRAKTVEIDHERSPTVSVARNSTGHPAPGDEGEQPESGRHEPQRDATSEPAPSVLAVHTARARAARRLTSAAGTTASGAPSRQSSLPTASATSANSTTPETSSDGAPARSPISCRTRPAHGPARLAVLEGEQRRGQRLGARAAHRDRVGGQLGDHGLRSRRRSQRGDEPEAVAERLHQRAPQRVAAAGVMVLVRDHRAQLAARTGARSGRRRPRPRAQEARGRRRAAGGSGRPAPARRRASRRSAGSRHAEARAGAAPRA